LLLEVQADSYALGAIVVQALPEAHGQGNDQWLPVSNTDGTYSFFSLSSALALDDPQSSTAPGTSLDQGSGNGTTAQSFNLISHVPADAEPDASDGSDSNMGIDLDAGAGVDVGADSEGTSAFDAAPGEAAAPGSNPIDAASSDVGSSVATGALGGTSETERSRGCVCATANRTGSSRAPVRWVCWPWRRS